MKPTDILSAVDKLNPLKNYLPALGLTHCNQFITDLCKELGVVMLWDLANKQFDWLDSLKAAIAGWSPCSRTDAQGFANQGRLVLVAFRNNDPPPHDHGHIAVVVPCTNLVKEPFIHISQAGASNFINGPMAHGFGFKPVKFWSNKGAA